MVSISFVILTWNRASMLEICLQNLVNSIKEKNQAEIIILDNASSDNTKDIIQEFVKKFSNQITIRVKILKKNKRLNSYKYLFFLAKGEIVIEVDDDVLSFPSHVDELYQKYFKAFPEFGCYTK